MGTIKGHTMYQAVDVFYSLTRWFRRLNIDGRKIKITITFEDAAEGWHAAHDLCAELNTMNLTGPMTPDALTREFMMFDTKVQFVMPAAYWRNHYSK